MSCLNPDDIHRIFTKLDKNGDGLITVEQLKCLLEKIGCSTTLEELQGLVGLEEGSPTCSSSSSLDSIDFFFFYDNFVNIKRSKEEEEEEGTGNSLDRDKDLAEAFKVFDLNGDGFISRDELRSALLRFGLWDDEDGGEDDCGNMIRIYDTNSDGLLDFEEFKKMMLMTTNSGGGC